MFVATHSSVCCLSSDKARCTCRTFSCEGGAGNSCVCGFQIPYTGYDVCVPQGTPTTMDGVVTAGSKCCVTKNDVNGRCRCLDTQACDADEVPVEKCSAETAPGSCEPSNETPQASCGS